MWHWKVAHSAPTAPTPETDRDPYAHTYFIVPFVATDTASETQTTVEFDAGAGASPAKALQILRPYLEREPRPPRRLIAGREGPVRELSE
jgi:hypothetical protein